MSASFAPSPPSRTLSTALGHCMGLSWLMSSRGCPFYLNDRHTGSTSCSWILPSPVEYPRTWLGERRYRVGYCMSYEKPRRGLWGGCAHCRS